MEYIHEPFSESSEGIIHPPQNFLFKLLLNLPRCALRAQLLNLIILDIKSNV